MKILGVDYGRAKIGLAIGEAGLAQPWKVMRVGSMEEAIGKVVQVVAGLPADRQVEQVVIGVSEQKMGQEQESFAKALTERVVVPVETWDETLSTKEAQQQAIKGGVPKEKRRILEDAFAAAVMLQSYLDQHGEDTPSV